MNGFALFHRKIIEWGWYKDNATFKLFFHLIISCNFKDGEFLGVKIKRGQVARSYATLSIETGLTIQQVRTAINHLKSTQELTQERHAKFSLFTIVKYDEYQTRNIETNSQITGEQQSANTGSTGEQQQMNNDNKAIKNNKDLKEKNIKKETFKKPSVEEVAEYCRSRNNNIDAEQFIDFYDSKGWFIGKNAMKDWKAAVRTWEKNKTGGKNNEQATGSNAKGKRFIDGFECSEDFYYHDDLFDDL